MFYHEPVGFTKLFLHGIEFHILSGYIALFAYVDYISGSSVLAAAAIWILDIFLTSIRQHFGVVNLSKKTLLDPKFLL